MRKSEHTELATLSRLAVYVSLNGLQNLSYGNAAGTAHLSKGALQRLFPDSERMQLAVIRHAAQLLTQHVFQYDRIEIDSIQQHLRRWASWICGENGLPGGCVLLTALCSRGLSAAVLAQAQASLQSFLQRLNALNNIVVEPNHSQHYLAAACALHAMYPWSAFESSQKLNWINDFPDLILGHPNQ